MGGCNRRVKWYNILGECEKKTDAKFQSKFGKPTPKVWDKG